MEYPVFKVYFWRTNTWSERMTLTEAKRLTRPPIAAVIVHVGTP